MSKLLERAKVKLENAKNNYSKMGDDDAYRDDVCYNLQQAIEMSLKSIVELNGLQYAENHDVRANLNILNHAGINLPIQVELRNMASTIYSWETESRYKDSFVSMTEDIDSAMQIAEKLIEIGNSMVNITNTETMEEIPDEKK